jgi:hypothetical protein
VTDTYHYLLSECLPVGSPFFGAFPSDSIPKATKDVSVRKFIKSFNFRDELTMDNTVAIKNSCKLYKRIPGIF